MAGLLTGYTVGVTADRRSEEQISLLTGRGAKCVHGPTIRTHPLLPEAEIAAPTKELLVHPPDVVVLTTGIGTRGWLEAADSLYLGEELRTLLQDTTILARGPKACGAAVTAGLDVAWNAPGATCAEVVAELADRDLEGLRVAVQQDGALGDAMLLAIEAMGAQVIPVPVYRWSLPADTGPAESLVRAVCDKTVDAITFTARPAVENFVAIAQQMECLDELTAACTSAVAVFCVGPVCAEAVHDAGVGTPLIPERSRLGAMVMQLSRHLNDSNQTIELGGQEVKIQGRMITVGDAEPTPMTDREHRVLGVLLERPGAVCSKQHLLQSVWGGDATDAHVVEVTVGRLRRRLGDAGIGIETVMRRGYRASAT